MAYRLQYSDYAGNVGTPTPPTPTPAPTGNGYRLRYSDYPGVAGPPDPGEFVGPPGPPGPMGPPGPEGPPGGGDGTGDFLPIAGGTVTGPIGFSGTSSTINTYDAQLSATGGATLPGNPGQGELNYIAGRHIFQGYDGTTQFRVSNVPWAWEWWEAIGGSAGTAATLRAGSDLNPDCSGAISAQGHGSLVFGNGEGRLLSLPSIGGPIINYLEIVNGLNNQGITLRAAGGDGLPATITLTAGYNGNVYTGNSNGPLLTINDPTTAGVVRTSWFSLTAGAAGFRPTIGLGGATNDDITIQASGTGGVIIGNGGGVLGIFGDPGPGVHSYLTFTPGVAGVAPPTVSSAGQTPSDIRITAVDTGAVTLSTWHGQVASFAGNSNLALSTWFQFQAGVVGAAPLISVGGTTNTDLRMNANGTGRISLLTGLTLSDGAAAIGDITKGIDFSGAGTWGINKWGPNLNFVVPTGGTFNYTINGASIGGISATGINYISIGQAGTASAGSFTTLSASGAATFTTIPTAPTATAGTSNTQLATTAFVSAAVGGGGYTLPTASTTVLGGVKIDGTTVTIAAGVITAAVPAKSVTTPIMDGTATIGSLSTYALADHIHPTDTSRYAAANPSGYQTSANVVTAIAAGNPGAFSTLSASSTVSGTGFSTYLASPPAIGGTAAAAGKFAALTVTSGVNFGSTFAASSTDLSKHIDLYGGTYGFDVTSGQLNYNAPVSTSHVFAAGGTTAGYINATGLNGMVIGAQSPRAGTFTTASASGLRVIGSVSSQTDLTDGIDLNYTASPGTCGITGYAGQVNIISSAAANAINLYFGTTTIGYFATNGMNYIPIGATGAAAGSFTTLLTSAGLSFATAAASATDLSKHINLGAGTIGINQFGGIFNFNAAAGTYYAWYVGGTAAAYLDGNGFTTVGTTLKIGSTGGAPTWTTGSGVPSSTQPVGSIYSRVSTWAAGATLYVSKGAGAWTAVASV